VSFATQLADPSGHLKFYAFIEGIPGVPTDAELPSAWFTGGRTQLTSALDVSRGIMPPAQKLHRKSGAASPTTMSLYLGPDDATGTLRSLFATELSSGNRNTLTATLDWTTGIGAIGKIYIDDHTGWAATGYAYIGRETIEYDALLNDGGGDYLRIPAGGRGKFESEPYKYLVDADTGMGSRTVADHPTIWEGRHVILYALWCNSEGEPLDTALGGDDSREIWRGQITTFGYQADNHVWEVRCRSIDAILDTQVGAYQADGNLAWTDNAGNPIPWNSGLAPVEIEVTAAQNNIRVWVDPGTGVYAANDTTLTAGLTKDLPADIADAIQTMLAAAYGGISWQVWGEWGDSETGEKPNIAILLSSNTYNIRLEVNEQSAFFLMGYSFEDSQEPAQTTNFPGTTNQYVKFNAAAEKPILVIPPDAASITFRETPSQYNTQFPTSGFAVLKVAGQSEIINYTGITVVAAQAPRVITITGVTRGRCETVAREIRLSPVDLDYVADEQAQIQAEATIHSCIGFEAESLISIFLKLCMSTGSSTLRHATYDSSAIPENAGGGFDSNFFDIDKFEDVANREGVLLMTRNIVFRKPFNLREWFSKEMALLGHVLLSRQSADGYRITVDKIGAPLVVGGDDVDSTNIVVTNQLPTVASSLFDTINVVKFKLLWNVAKEEFGKAEVLYNDGDAQIDTNTRQALALEGRGFPFDMNHAREVADFIATGILKKFSRKDETVTLTVNKEAWNFRPGQQVRVTLAGPPQIDGTSGYSDQSMIVMGVKPTYVGRERKPATELTLLHMPYSDRYSYYCPCCEITNVAWPVVTVAANAFTTSTQENPVTGDDPVKDIQWFSDGDNTYILDPGNEAASRVVQQINTVNAAANTITFNGGAPGFIGVGDYITYPDYANASATQKLYCYIADNNANLGAANDPAFQYGV